MCAVPGTAWRTVGALPVGGERTQPARLLSRALCAARSSSTLHSQQMPSRDTALWGADGLSGPVGRVSLGQALLLLRCVCVLPHFSVTVLVSSGCCDRGPQTERLQQQQRVFSQFWGRKSAVRVPVSLLWCPLVARADREEVGSLGSLLGRAPPPDAVTRGFWLHLWGTQTVCL